jgi:TonB family protein
MRKPLLVAGALLLLTPCVFSQVVTPDFPPEALGRVQGTEKINVFVEIDKSGHVVDAEAFGPWLICGKGDEIVALFRNAAVEAARKSVFTPRSTGKSGTAAISLAYTVQGNAPPPAIDRKGDIVNGTPTTQPQPAYPAKAKKFGVQGPVTISVSLDEEGKPIEVRAKSGHTLLLDSAARAACDARWTPTLLAGKPVKVSASITYNFAP